MATSTNALPQLDMSKSVPLDQATPTQTSTALPQLDMSKSVPITTDTSAPAPMFNGPIAQKIGEFGDSAREAAGDIWGAVKNIGLLGTPAGAETAAKGIWNSLPPVQLTDNVKQILPLIHEYEKARSSGASIPDAIRASDAAARQHVNNINPIQSVVSAFRANPTRETGRALLDAAAVATSMLIPGALETAFPEAAAATEAPEAAEAVGSPSWLARNNPFRTPATAADQASQPIAQAGVKSVAPTVDSSFRSGIDVQTPFADAKALYQSVDKAANTNFRDLYTKLDGAQDDARQAASGSPEEAKAQLNIKNTQDAIDDAKAAAAKSGVPDVDKTLAQADAKFTTAQANKDFNSKFFGNKNVVRGNVAHGVPETIDVDNALDTLETMDKPNKFGVSRLQQTSLGKDGAFDLKQVLYDAQKAGVKALNKQVLIQKWAKIAGVGTEVVGGGLGLWKYLTSGDSK